MELFNQNEHLHEFRKKQGNERADKMRDYLGVLQAITPNSELKIQ